MPNDQGRSRPWEVLVLVRRLAWRSRLCLSSPVVSYCFRRKTATPRFLCARCPWSSTGETTSSAPSPLLWRERPKPLKPLKPPTSASRSSYHRLSSSFARCGRHVLLGSRAPDRCRRGYVTACSCLTPAPVYVLPILAVSTICRLQRPRIDI